MSEHPQALSRSITLRLDERSATALDRLADATQRTTGVLIRDWTMERLAFLPTEATAPAVQDAAATPIDVDPIEKLRQYYRPADIVVLLVGESPPAGGTFFYQANSHLFDATREAFERALGPVPDGPDFLDHFKERGFWLYDVVAEPVNRTRGRPRNAAVSAGVTALAELIADVEPDFVVAVKTSLESVVRQAAAIAAFPSRRLRILPFPLYQWRAEYVTELARFLNPPDASLDGTGGGDLSGSAAEAATSRTLHEAMRSVLLSHEGRPMPARQLANDIARLGLYERRDGTRADYQQILARARKYPKLFGVSRDGVSLLHG